MGAPDPHSLPEPCWRCRGGAASTLIRARRAGSREFRRENGNPRFRPGNSATDWLHLAHYHGDVFIRQLYPAKRARRALDRRLCPRCLGHRPVPHRHSQVAPADKTALGRFPPAARILQLACYHRNRTSVFLPMRILFIGDIFGRPGRTIVKDRLPGIVRDKADRPDHCQWRKCCGGFWNHSRPCRRAL